MARRGPSLRPIIQLVVAATALLTAAPLRAQATRPAAAPGRPTWRATTGLIVGALLAPREIGRDMNATGGEDLIAFLGNAFALGFYGGVESDAVGIQLEVAGGVRAVEVENEYGVAFPFHGEAPGLWTVSLHLYPLFMLRGTAAGRVQPLALIGIGGFVVSVDLDNVNDQTTYHSWQWAVGGGLRVLLNPAAAFDSSESFVELRLLRHRVWENGPLYRFDAVAATLGVGMRI